MDEVNTLRGAYQAMEAFIIEMESAIENEENKDE
jgi:hypothetical protein